MSYYRVVYSDSFLMHHGIQGQKWGKRNGPPYPLKSSQLNSKEKFYRINIDSSKKRVNDVLGINGKASTNKSFTSEELQDATKHINPSKSKTNCGACAASILVNLSSKDKVSAISEAPENMRIKGGKGYDPDKLIDCFEGNHKWTSVEGINRTQKCNNLEKELLSQGDGAKGIFYAEKLHHVNYGHYFTYVVNDGSINILEGQPPAIQSTGLVKNGLYNDVFDYIDAEQRVRYSRLDNDGIVSVKANRRKDLFNE